MTEQLSSYDEQGGDYPEPDALGVFFEESKKNPLLKGREQEAEFAQRIEVGLYAEQVVANAEKSGEELPYDREDYQTLIDEGRKAKLAFFLGNQGLVISIAKRYRNRYNPSVDDFFEVIQNGQEGLNHAIGKFDYKKGFKFSTYATWWIRQSLNRNGRDGLIHLPEELKDAYGKIQRERFKFYQERGYFPSDDELAGLTGASPETTKSVMNARSLHSLNKPVGESDGLTLGDFIADTSFEDDQDAIHDRLVVERLLPFLDKQQAAVIRLRFGFVTGEPMSLREVGKRMNLSHERIGQIERMSLRILKEKMLKKTSV